MAGLLIFAVLALLAAFWIFQFVQLMALSDHDFPGRYDKPLWVAAFLLGTVLGAAAFWFWKSLILSVREQERSGEDERP